eukprot:TRINITY_DN774_c0_g1_i1.p1 TRINITY_DN774_c0_g1~~TRINITY_DN774_c0_g1_i1.p1  ORF type:complete len:485 (-),score=101.49 TRINITY_DN774_c0_g1_i1:1-1455(-)
MPKVRCCFLFILVLSFFIPYLYNVVTNNLEINKQVVPKNDDDCKRIKGVIGSEDITRVIFKNIEKNNIEHMFDKWLLITSDDRTNLWCDETTGPNFTENGNVFAYNVEMSRLYKMKLNGFPIDLENLIAFHPHGLYLHKETNQLYVVSHAYKKGGERIEVFTIIENNQYNNDNNNNNNNDDDEDINIVYDESSLPNDIPFKLVHSHSIIPRPESGNNSDFNGILNDLLVLNENEFYVTNFRVYPDSLSGHKHQNPKTFSDYKNSVLDIVGGLSQQSNTFLWHCHRNTDIQFSSDTINNNNNNNIEYLCKHIYQGVALNGINEVLTHPSLNQEKESHILISDPVFHQKQIHLLKRNKLTNKLTFITHLNLPFSVDNIEVDLDSHNNEIITAGGIGKLLEVLKYSDNPHNFSNDKLNNLVSGSIIELFPTLPSKENNFQYYDISVPIIHSGNLLSGISSSIYLNPDQKNTVLFGSWFDEGLLVCPL